MPTSLSLQQWQVRDPRLDRVAEEVGSWACLHKAVCPVVGVTPSEAVEEVIKAVQVWFCVFKSHSAKKKKKKKNLKVVSFSFLITFFS